MKCDEIRGQFSAYLDEELDAQARAEVEKHLDGCASCHAEWESYCALHHAFASLELEELPADFSANFRARLAKERKQPSAMPFYISIISQLSNRHPKRSGRLRLCTVQEEPDKTQKRFTRLIIISFICAELWIYSQVKTCFFNK